ncbi:hypothetical protein FA13DRAFT_1719666 [Coprinellus micaceus]|uniref:Uncharacterized protein n=1 Tax=Coprinellus micaceus TaxID=71717 RepID=A0A4Y7SAU9_COPMI|nr:hypothetical protein FA13DRAFT_1719666 [Coprinellus micaceus]
MFEARLRRSSSSTTFGPLDLEITYGIQSQLLIKKVDSICMRRYEGGLHLSPDRNLCCTNAGGRIYAAGSDMQAKFPPALFGGCTCLTHLRALTRLSLESSLGYNGVTSIWVPERLRDVNERTTLGGIVEASEGHRGIATILLVRSTTGWLLSIVPGKMGSRSEDGRRQRARTTTAREGGACGGEEMMGAGRKKRREGRAAICDTG